MEDEKRLLLSYCCRGALSADEEFSFSSVWYSLATFSSRRKKEGGGGRRRRRRERSVIDFRMIDSSRGGRYELGIDRCKPRRPNRRQLPQQQQQSSSSFGGDLVLTAMAEKRKWEKTLQFNYGYIDKGRYVRFRYYYLVFFFFFFLPVRVRLDASDSVREWPALLPPRLPSRSVSPWNRSANPWRGRLCSERLVVMCCTGLVVVVAPAAPASAKAAKLLTEPVALCAVIGAQAVAELNMAMSFHIKRK